MICRHDAGGLTLTLSLQVSGSLGCVVSCGGDVWGGPSICISGVAGAGGAQ